MSRLGFVDWDLAKCCECGYIHKNLYIDCPRCGMGETHQHKVDVTVNTVLKYHRQNIEEKEKEIANHKREIERLSKEFE